ncbi:hypothetical protein ACFP1Z_30915 [Streptomyces gamaensis]|uniref:Transposase n=1 Tax=Streptomyces gamaensis TaxID=1763542 RepID=A0ABW0Z6Y1_9ACTN
MRIASRRRYGHDPSTARSTVTAPDGNCRRPLDVARRRKAPAILPQPRAADTRRYPAGVEQEMWALLTLHAHW